MRDLWLMLAIALVAATVLVNYQDTRQRFRWRRPGSGRVYDKTLAPYTAKIVEA